MTASSPTALRQHRTGNRIDSNSGSTGSAEHTILAIDDSALIQRVVQVALVGHLGRLLAGLL